MESVKVDPETSEGVRGFYDFSATSTAGTACPAALLMKINHTECAWLGRILIKVVHLNPNAHSYPQTNPPFSLYRKT